MTLDKYRSKRNVENSHEPEGNPTNSSSQNLKFVIQKHQASHLHYDLRLELDGVLKSWAIPKGVPSEISRKRLAVMVEDHPLEYCNFEGIIPKGNYGAGTVMIWDEGWYDIPGIETKLETQQRMRDLLNKGHIVFCLHGHKIDGTFHLVKTRKLHNQNTWLIFIAQDNSCLYYSYSERSVRSGRTMDQIRSNLPEDNSLSSILESPDISNLPSGSWHREPFKPMMAQLAAEPFNRPEWIFEIKWDGYRAIAEICNGTVKLYSRNGKILNLSFPPVIDNLKILNFNAVIDGEIVIVNKEGKADFNALQNYVHTKKGCLVYYAFDLLFLEKYDLRRLPLIKRKEILKSIIPQLPHIRYNDHIEENGVEFFRIAKENNIEGIMAKDAASPYLEGKRSWYWQKFKNTRQQEFVIGGFTQSKDTRRLISSLLVGVYNNRELIFCGGVGGGFSEEELQDIYIRLKTLQRDTSPFKGILPSNINAIWVEPVLVCEIRFAEWTSEGQLRQPVFLGFREDVSPSEVYRETPTPEPPPTP